MAFSVCLLRDALSRKYAQQRQSRRTGEDSSVRREGVRGEAGEVFLLMLWIPYTTGLHQLLKRSGLKLKLHEQHV
jgi:hypothetical protein